MNIKIINFGSINIDHVYRVPHFVQPGETLGSTDLTTGLGGKGANQSVAIAKAGVSVAHLGRVSVSDKWAVDLLASSGVNVAHIKCIDEASGHAIIQVNAQGENSIILHGGANQNFERPALKSILEQYDSAEYLLMQNECNLLTAAFEIAQGKGIKTVLNPAPMSDNIKDLPLDNLDILIVNQGEAEALSGDTNLDCIIEKLVSMVPRARVVITLGAEGAVLISDGEIVRAKAPTVEVVDTTAAGDTFVGYFLAGLIEGLSDHDALQTACLAASLTATREGAIAAIPFASELS